MNVTVESAPSVYGNARPLSETANVFGVVALLAVGGLVVPGLFWRLGMTAPPAVASPFLALLERPG